MSTTEVVDAVLRLLAILVSWPLVLLVVVIIVRRKLPDLLEDLVHRVRKAPGGFEFDQLREEVASVADEVTSVAQRVKRIEEAVIIQPSASLTPALEEKLQTSLSKFYEYLITLGFETGESPPTLALSSDMPGVAYYDRNQNVMFIGESMAENSYVCLRTYAEYALISTAPEPAENWAHNYLVVESGLANYFPCSFADDASLGASLGVYNLEDGRKFTEDLTEPVLPQTAGVVWASAFWDIRKRLQKEVTDRLLLSAWKTQSLADLRSDDPKSFLRALMNEARHSIDSVAVDTIRSVFQRRGLEA
jgi:hypothetical protein